MAKSKKPTKGKSLSQAQEALQFAQEKAKTSQTWIELSNAMYGIGGKFSELFPTQSERVQFTKSEEYAKIQELIGTLPGPGSTLNEDVSGANGTMIVRGPKSLHAALLAEAKAEGVSLNQLCIAKLSVQLRAQISPLSSRRTQRPGLSWNHQKSRDLSAPRFGRGSLDADSRRLG